MAADLSRQLTDLSDSLRSTNSLIARLAKLPLQPGAEPLEGDGVHAELAQNIHDSLKELEENLEFLQQEAEEYKADGRRRNSTRDGEQARLTAKVARLGEDLVHSRQQFRNARIAAKLASDEAKRKERELLLESYRKEADQIATAETSDSTANDRELLFAQRGRRQQQQQRQRTKDEVLVDASSDVTAALRRTHDLLSTELSRSRFAQETFDESTQALAQLGEDYSNLDTILSNSKNLLGTLLRSQKSDTWYLETAFYILLTTLCWLFFRRILFGPFVKLPIFLWNTFAFVVNWGLLKPLFFLLSSVGVITTQPVSSLRASSSVISSSRPPLIVQPSATGRPPPLPKGIKKSGVPAGAGGAGAKVRKEDVEGPYQTFESIADMAEESAKQANEAPSGNEPQRRGDGTILEERQEPANPKKKQFEEGGAEPQRRGDGTVLEERQEPANPKKKQFEADVEDSKQRRKRDEL